MAPAAAPRDDGLAMNAIYILGALSIVFLGLAARNLIRDGRITHPQTKTWLIVGVVFGAIALWLAANR